MTGSQNKQSSLLVILFQDSRTVFKMADIAMLTGETRLDVLSKKLHYYVKKGDLGNPRKGIYTKTPYQMEELACRLYTPSYLSLEWVLAKSGIVFQYSSKITMVSYLSRNATVEDTSIQYRAVKKTILVNTNGISRSVDHLNIATPERAFLDLLYLQPDGYCDHIEPLNQSEIKRLIPLYQSNALKKRALQLIGND